MESILEETATRILSDHGGGLPGALWSTLEENGLTRLWAGDSGFEMAPGDGFGLMRLAGEHAVPVPLAETLMATWFLTEARIRPPPGQLSIVIDGFQRGIAFGGGAGHVVRVQGRLVSLHHGHLSGPVRCVGEDPMSDATALTDQVLDAGHMPFDTGRLFAALGRAAQICGALDAVLNLTIEFAEQREQFGRPLAKFQAIQHLLADMATEAAAAGAALDAAAATVERGGALDHAAISVAKYRASCAAGIVSEHAHQVHGAIGYTQEYRLGRFTRRLWQWREDFGGEAYWAEELGRAVLGDSTPLWLQLTDGGGS